MVLAEPLDQTGGIAAYNSNRLCNPCSSFSYPRDMRRIPITSIHLITIYTIKRYRPTVSLGVTSAVASSCGQNSGQIEHRVAHELAEHWATHEGPAERPPHRHPPPAQPLAPVRQHHGRRPRLTPRGCTDQTPPSDEEQPYGHIREA